MSDKPVFFDASGRRAVRVSLVGWTAVVVSLALGAAFAASLVVAPQVTQLRLPGRLTATPTLEKKALAPGLLRSAARLATEAQMRRRERARLRMAREQRDFPA